MIERIALPEARELLAQYHAYKGAGGSATYALGVREGGRVAAAFLWQPPAPGAAKSVCPEAPHAVLALSRMVAIPRDQRDWHISKFLRKIMRHHIDRTRWPVLVTYSDESAGHTGHVYKCSGWQPTTRKKVPFYEDSNGVRVSSYSCGASAKRGKPTGHTWIQRWEHWACDKGAAHTALAEAGWVQQAIPGKVWASKNQAHRWVKVAA